MDLDDDSRGLAHHVEFQFLTKNTVLVLSVVLRVSQDSSVETALTEVSTRFDCAALFWAVDEHFIPSTRTSFPFQSCLRAWWVHFNVAHVLQC